MRICLLRLALLALLGAAACGDEWDGTLDGELRSLGEVGVAGGRLCAGSLCVVVPAGALDQTVELHARLVLGVNNPREFVISGFVYELALAVTRLNKPVTLELPVMAGVKADDLAAISRVTAAVSWRLVPGQSAGPVVKVHTGHLSGQWATAKVGGSLFTAMALGDKGQIALVDRGKLQVVQLASPTDPPASWKVLDGKGLLTRPAGIAFAPDGSLLISDTNRSGVLAVEDITGKGAKWLHSGGGGAGGEIKAPERVFVSPAGRLLVGYHGFHVADANDLKGAEAPRTWAAGGRFAGAAEFKGTIYQTIATPGDNNDFIWALESKPIVVGRLSAGGALWAGARRAVGLAVDSLYRIYVADAVSGAVIRMDDGKCSGAKVVWNKATAAVVDLAMDASDNLYIATHEEVTRIALDGCPKDKGKMEPGVCGCGVADTDTDGDKTPDCNDSCPKDKGKTAPGVCGCGVADTDTDGDKTPDCNDSCPKDKVKTAPGICGCGTAETDGDGDGLPDCKDTHPKQACPCFKLAALKAARAATGAKCHSADKLLIMSATYDGVVQELTNKPGYYAAMLTGVEVDTALGGKDYYCGGGCYENPVGFGSACNAKAVLKWTTLSSQTAYDACLELVKAACK